MTVISHDEDDGIDNADGTAIVAVRGPMLGCLNCGSDQTTRWSWGDAVECDGCLEVLAEE